MENKEVIPIENALSLNNCFQLLAKLELMYECVDYVLKDVAYYLDNEEITYALDFQEIYAELFPVKSTKEEYFKEINRIWVGILPFKQRKDSAYDNIQFTLLPGTIFEFYREFVSRYKDFINLPRSKFESLITSLEEIEKQGKSAQLSWEKSVSLGDLEEFYSFCTEKGPEQQIIQPLKKLLAFLKSGTILPMEHIPKFTQIITEMKLHEPSRIKALNVLESYRPYKTTSNVIDSYNISFITEANLLIPQHTKKYHIQFASHGYVTLSAIKNITKIYNDNNLLPIQRHSLSISYLMNLIKNVSKSDAISFLNNSKIPLSQAIRALKDVAMVKKTLSLHREDQRKYLEANGENPVFLPYDVFLSSQYLHRIYIDKLQSKLPDKDDVLSLVSIPLNKIWDNLLDWRRTKEIRDRIVVESKKFREEIDDILGEFYQNFLPINDPKIKQVLDFIHKKE